jgi:hypothetical protein
VPGDVGRRGLREGLGLAQQGQDAPIVTQRPERRAQGDAEIDGLLACVALLRQMREGTERLLEGPHGLTVGRSCHGFLSRLPTVYQGLGPHLAPEGMVGQPFHLLGHLVSGKCLQGRDDPSMECPPPLLEQRLIGHLLGEGVLEGILDVGEEARLIEEFGGLQMCEAQAQRRLRHLGNGLEKHQGHLHANDRGGLEKLFLLRRQPIEARRQHCLHRDRYLNARQRSG